MEHDRPQHDLLTACVIAQQYFPSNFRTLRSLSYKGKSGASVQKVFLFRFVDFLN
jgi:hypothetical protein